MTGFRAGYISEIRCMYEHCFCTTSRGTSEDSVTELGHTINMRSISHQMQQVQTHSLKTTKGKKRNI